MALDDGDHHLRELLIIKSKRENDVVDYTTKTMDQLKDMISKRKGYLSTLRFKDNGDKLKTIRICEAELQRRRNNNHKRGIAQCVAPSPPPPPPPPQPKEGTFSCPVCLGPLVEEVATKCGHIFCKACITAATNAQHKCPTCRQQLTNRDFIRVYLPAATK
ncbi:putative Zinc finger, RING-type [Helianthus annuus]|uniref:Putative zinc finger, RING/FYVE/PHD-type n=1 Tax=Helianthus annuus TaxID=4232 RepID=A0A251T2U7_HELAN|nr:putative Zinc finger, RING-type [Helianthus annuus]KAJ0489564.1 putative Zinc finger, RING-type [Helianthus annuus]KAJ0505477.1 putative Zinc finger, RING-type [Helianthus annuus]KAJ0675152.1 putative Zinc finger, RING-type [Helianthus annuus]KAJ0866731.1 putative Zinc finger, RING-type [Helianthus annuus]